MATKMAPRCDTLGPRWPKMAPRCEALGAKMAQDATHWDPVAQDGAKMKQDRSRRVRMNAAEGSWRELWELVG